MLDHDAFRFMLVALEICGYMGNEAVQFVNRLGDIAAESGRIPNGAAPPLHRHAQRRTWWVR